MSNPTKTTQYFFGLALNDKESDLVNNSQFALPEMMELQHAWARDDLSAVALVLERKAVERASGRADAVEALRRPEPTLFPLEPITATDQEIHLHVVIPTCCKPDQVEAVARDIARSLHYSVGSGVRVEWVHPTRLNTMDAIDVTFSSSAHRDHAVSP